MLFRTIHTDHGLQCMAEAEATGKPIKLTAMAAGDGGGKALNPVSSMTQLVNEIAGTRTAPNAVYRDTNNLARYTVEMLIPASLGGFYLREIGIYDDAGKLFAVGSLPETYKPHETDGAYGDFAARMEFLVTNADIVEFNIDPNVIIATRDWTLKQLTASRLLPGGLANQVLTKNSNLDGDVSWKAPGDFTVVVNTIEEQQVLAAEQVNIDLVMTNTNGLAIYINGERLPNKAGADGWQPSTTLETRAILGKSYPAGTKVIAVQNEPASQLSGALQEVMNLADLDNVETARQNLDVFSREESRRLAPASEVAYFARPTAPDGWLKANGAAVSRTAYQALFEVIGTTYGEGDKFNTFNLPDLRGEFLRCWDDGRGIDAQRGLGAPQDSQNLAHGHTGATSSAGSHSHSYVDGRPMHPPGDPGLANGSVFKGIWENSDTRTTGSAGSHSHTVTINATGGSEARPRNIALLACIKY